MDDLKIKYARRSLQGVSIGDAFGESFFGETASVMEHIHRRQIPETRWEFTDDTVLSIAVLDELIASGGNINPDTLARRFSRNHELDLNRGYGATARSVLRQIHSGMHWQKVAPAVFDRQGSMGNGAAMRVCPIGAYHYDNPEKVIELAAISAAITHAHPEAISGAIAIGLATALATEAGLKQKLLAPLSFIDQILTLLPDSDTKSKISISKTIPCSYHIETVRQILGNGTNMTAQDTVPFVIWCAAHHMNHFENALWKAVSILGDRDTICAMVGGITIMSSADSNIPVSWRDQVEDVETSIFRDQTIR